MTSPPEFLGGGPCGAHSFAKADTGGEVFWGARRNHALRNALNEGFGRAQALVVGRSAGSDGGRLTDAVDDTVRQVGSV